MGYTMRMPGNSRLKWIQHSSITAFVLWGLVFAVAYTQSPLYTSNQNQYFLHGLAWAGYGELTQDWLANTLDPTPIYSLLVEVIYSVFHWEGFFYLLYAGLMGVYFYSLWGIVDHLLDLRSSSEKTLLVLTLLVLVHSAGLRFALSRGLGVNWTYVLEDGVADQRLLGPVFQPSTFGVFLLLSIYLFLENKHFLAILSALGSTAFHPTYLLGAASLTVAYVIVIGIGDRNVKKALALGLLAFVGVIPILMITYPVFLGDSADVAVRARDILVNYRIPHHALVSVWFDATVVVKILIVISGIFLARRSRLFLILLVCTGTAVVLTLAQLVLDSQALALIFPWRISTFIVPLCSALIIATLVDWLLNRPQLRSANASRVIRLVSTLVIVLAVFTGVVRFVLDLNRKASAPERAVEVYVADHLSAGESYLIPVKMQDFRLAAGAPAFVDFKSIPYSGLEVLEWYQRVKLAEEFYKDGDCSVLKQLRTDYAITQVITESGSAVETCPGMELLYKDSAYSLWRATEVIQ
jgi:Domain of unknown function (DUF6798)